MDRRSCWIFAHPKQQDSTLGTASDGVFRVQLFKTRSSWKDWVAVSLSMHGTNYARFISRSFSHSECLRVWCFGICCRQMEAFSNIFSETSRLSFCRFSCLTKTEVDTGFYDRIQRSSSTSFHEIFDNYFSSFGRYWYLHYCCKQKSGP